MTQNLRDTLLLASK